MSRHQHLLIRRLVAYLDRAMTRAGHLAQVVPWEHMGNCSTQKGCTAECIEAQELKLLVEPYRRPAVVKPVRSMRLVVLKRPTKPARTVRRVKPHESQPALFGEAV